jgi:hypothetical protein
MLGKLLLIFAAALSGPASAIALAAPCQAVFHFDGDLSDSSPGATETGAAQEASRPVEG